MNPLILAGAASALSFAKDLVSSGLAKPRVNEAAQGDFQKALSQQRAAEGAAEQLSLGAPGTDPAKALDPEVQAVALQVLQMRQDAVSSTVSQAVGAGQMNLDQAGAVGVLQTSARKDLDAAMADGVLTVGEFRQVNVSMDRAGAQAASYMAGRSAGAPSATNTYRSVSVTV